jgi:predicted Rossmann-fold nucleotide-binding protein
MSKMIVCGGRDYHLSEEDYKYLALTVMDYGIEEIVTGGASGADEDALAWAERNGIPTKTFYAQWITHGPKAGPIRNAEMAKYATHCMVFPGGAGTLDMRRKASRAGLNMFVARAAPLTPSHKV